jgi:guanylate kinase
MKSTRPLLIVLSGPSGVGKDAVLNELKKCHPNIHYATTTTTRPKRPGEVEGDDYNFVDERRFLSMIKDDQFLEHAEVYGRRYGVPRAALQNALNNGQNAIVKVDIQGAETIRSKKPDSILIFLAAPDPIELERRLRDRKMDSPKQLKIRVKTALREMGKADKFDHVIVNHTDRLNETVLKVLNIIETEHRRQF